MKNKFVWLAIAAASLTIFYDVEGSAQAIPYNNGPISYIGNNDNDDVGLLLTVLLLATRGRGCGDCCCCNGNTGNTVPIPYPIPIPTNNPIINFKKKHKAKVPDEKDIKQSNEVINVITENESNTETETQTNNKLASSSNSQAGANANSRVSPR